MIIIRSLVPGGAAELDGRLEPGDRLVFVNEVSVYNANLDVAVQSLMGAPRGVVRLTVLKSEKFGESSTDVVEQVNCTCLSYSIHLVIHSYCRTWLSYSIHLLIRSYCTPFINSSIHSCCFVMRCIDVLQLKFLVIGCVFSRTSFVVVYFALHYTTVRVIPNPNCVSQPNFH